MLAKLSAVEDTRYIDLGGGEVGDLVRFTPKLYRNLPEVDALAVGPFDFFDLGRSGVRHVQGFGGNSQDRPDFGLAATDVIEDGDHHADVSP